MNNNDIHFFKEWIRKNERSLKNKIRLERIRNELNKKKEKDNDKEKDNPFKVNMNSEDVL